MPSLQLHGVTRIEVTDRLVRGGGIPFWSTELTITGVDHVETIDDRWVKAVVRSAVHLLGTEYATVDPPRLEIIDRRSGFDSPFRKVASKWSPGGLAAIVAHAAEILSEHSRLFDTRDLYLETVAALSDLASALDECGAGAIHPSVVKPDSE